MRTPARISTFLVLGSLALIPSACGSDDDSSSTDKAATTQETDPNMETFPTTETKPRASAPASDAEAGDAVTIKDFEFGPDAIKVKKGDKLTFTNEDDAGHTATADDDSFDTGSLDGGKKKTVTITKSGTIPYICDFHPYMKGTVVAE